MNRSNGSNYQNMGSAPALIFNTNVEKSENISTYSPSSLFDNYSSKPLTTKVENYNSDKKDAYMKPATKESTSSNKKDEQQVSWTNYISMEFKLEES